MPHVAAIIQGRKIVPDHVIKQRQIQIMSLFLPLKQEQNQGVTLLIVASGLINSNYSRRHSPTPRIYRRKSRHQF